MTSRSDMENWTPLSVLSLAPTSRESLEIFVDFFREELEAGRLDPLKTMLLIKGMEEACKKTKEIIKQEALREAEKYGKGTHETFGFNFSVMESGVKYDFENTGDPIWKNLALKLKEREEMLKKLTGIITVIDEYSGEEAKVSRAAKSSTTTIKIEMPKSAK